MFLGDDKYDIVKVWGIKIDLLFSFYLYRFGICGLIRQDVVRRMSRSYDICMYVSKEAVSLEYVDITYD